MRYFRKFHFKPLYGKQQHNFSNDIMIPKDFLPDKPFLIRALLTRENTNQNSFVLVVGNPRTGKSMFGQKMCEEIANIKGTEFDVEKQLTFDDVKKFMIWSKTATESQFILDETGVSSGASSDNFWSFEQRIFRQFVQTQGFRKNILFWILPSVVFLQKRFRFLTNYAVKTVRQGTVNVYKVIVDQLLGKGFPEYRETINFKLPSDRILEPYLKMKQEFNDQKLKEDVDFLEMLEKPQHKKLKPEQYIGFFKMGLINKEELKQHLTELNYSENDIDLIAEKTMLDIMPDFTPNMGGE